MFYNGFGDFMKKNLNVIELIEKAINDLRPYINMEGGDIEFVKYIDTNHLLIRFFVY